MAELSIIMFISVLFSGFSSFFKPVFSIRSLHPSLLSNRVANSTVSSSYFRKRVSIFTMGFSSIYGLKTDTSKTVYLLCYQFKMFWITTFMISAKMIYLEILSIFYTSWNRLNIEGIYNSMYSLRSMPVPQKSVPLLVERTCPVPTFRFNVFGNLFEDSFMFFDRHCNNKFIHERIIP